MQVLFEVELEIDESSSNFELISTLDEEYSLISVEEDSDFTLEISDAPEYSLDIQDDDALYIIESGLAIVNYIDGEVYNGPYNVTPSREQQVLITAEKILLSNVVVDPIPSNYGLVTWNGTILTIS